MMKISTSISEELVNRLKSMVETELYKIEGYPLERGKIREFARAIKEDNPIFYEEEAARKLGFRSASSYL
ncbi:MaoC family dehydratase N-terminal domain-containing protein [Oceanobacillus longus]|uniref:MaoC family dehydratase N-terminal domain-containing protein n=1 Tax=Oceanobacillus longus TaxID=930120 RepID=A0ABV8GUD8_9BACI